MATETLERPISTHRDTGDPSIAHIVMHPEDMIGLCGARLRGVIPPPDHQLCVVCDELARAQGINPDAI